MKRDRFFYLWLLLLLVGTACTCILLGGRIRSECRDNRVAAVVYYEDLTELARLSGQTENDWLSMFSRGGVRYVVFRAKPDTAVQAMLTQWNLSPAGYVGDGSAFVLPDHNWPADGDIPLVLIENSKRTSVEYPDGFDLNGYDGALVKAFYLNDDYAARFSVDGTGQEIENMLFRAAIDRGMRLIFLRPFMDSDNTVVADYSVYARVLSGLSERLEARGLEYGENFSCMQTTALRPILLLGSGCLSAALWIFLVTQLKSFRRWGFVLCLLALAGLALGCLLLPRLMQKALMLLCAVVFPSVAVYGLWRWQKNPHWKRRPDWLSYLLGLFALLVWSLLGGFAVGALMGDRSYLMGDLIFSGVKAAQFFPLLLCLVLFVVPVVKEFFDGPITKKKILLLLGVAGLLAGAGVVLVLRSGDFARVSSMETAFRNALEYSFYTRPRTKELLIAVPFMALGFTVAGKKNALIMLLASLCSCLESISVVNTFCHAVAPIHVSLIRAVLAAGIGCLLGLLLIVLCRVIFYSSAKNAKDQRLDR